MLWILYLYMILYTIMFQSHLENLSNFRVINCDLLFCIQSITSTHCKTSLWSFPETPLYSNQGYG